MSAVIPADDGLGGDDDGSIDSSSSSGGESVEDVNTSATDDDSQQGADDDASTPAARGNRDDTSMPEPRQHAYLPGASHPLYPEEWIGRSGVSRHGQHGSPAAGARAARNCSRITSISMESNMYDPTPPTIPAPNSTIIELPILELDDVILFPGCTVPLRLRHPGWVEYLGRRIDEARFGYGAGGDCNPDQQQVRIGVMMRLRETRRQTRRRRPREAPATREGGGDVVGSEQSSAEHAAGRARQGRWRMDSLRRGVVRRRDEAEEPEQEEQEGVAEGNDTENDDAVQSDTERPRRQRDNDSGQSLVRPGPPQDPRIGRIGTVAIVTYTHEVAAEGESTAATDEVTGNGNGADSPSYRSRVWLRHSGQLVMTAMGTARFKILSRIDTGSTTLDAEQRVYPEMFRGDMADIKLYAVELLVDENLPLPPIRPLPRSSLSTEDGAKSAHCDMIEMLSQITPMPSFAYNSHWPWKLVQEICMKLSEIPAWEGLWKSLPPSSGYTDSTTNKDCAYVSNQADPLTFAFWMASNMPLPISERLDMLEMDCNVERLRLILVKVAQQRLLERPIRCKQCGETITTISSLFTIGGAEGTTGAYVNEYGIVHQTQTVRIVDSDHVFCVGNRESRDSWFDGYTWTIMHCATCAAHLGWKFDAIRGQGPTHNTEDRPKRFFGLTGGAVTTEESSAPRRVAGGLGSIAERMLMNAVRLQALRGMAAEDDRADASASEDGGEDDDEEEGAEGDEMGSD